MAEIPANAADVSTLPCGCVIGTVDDAFFIAACSLGLDCEYVQFSIAETARQGKPHEIRGDHP